MMRFRTPKVSTEEKNWSVVLHPLKSELDKKRAAEKVSELFRVSFEEARELVENTPIILLDQLSHSAALEVQSIFQSVRAEASLTSDPSAKRRCYRAVWQEPPNLSGLSPNVSHAPQEKIVPEVPVETATQPSAPPIVSREAEHASEALHQLEKRCRELELLYDERTRESAELRRSLDEELRKQSEKDTAKLRSVVNEWEERYQSLKTEYQQSKAIYEEKILEKTNDFEKQHREFLEKLSQVESSRQELERLVKERSDEVNQWREKYHVLAQKCERIESLYEGERKRREQVEEASHQSSEQAERNRRDLEIQVTETERWRKKYEELSQLSEEQESEVRELREANRSLEVQLESVQRQARELLFRVEEQQLIEKRVRLANELTAKEARLRELVLEGERVRQEVQDRELHSQTLANELANLEREILEVKQAQRHLLEQGKLKEKGSKLKRLASDSFEGRTNPAPSAKEQGDFGLTHG